VKSVCLSRLSESSDRIRDLMGRLPAGADFIGEFMSQKKLLVLIVAVLAALSVAPLVLIAQAEQGQQAPADGQTHVEGRGSGSDGQAPRGDGRGGDARGGQGGRGAQAQGQAIKQIKPGLYMVTGAGGNSTVRVAEEGVILVDTKNLGDQFYNDLVAQIKTVSTQPVKNAFVTHVHQDHAANIERFQKAGTQVIVYEALS